MLLEYGLGKQPGTWHVLETKPPLYVRVYYILGGNTVYRSGQQVQPLQKGWLYLFPAHAPYEMTTDPADPLVCMHLHLDLHTASLSRMAAVHADEDRELRHLLQVIRDGIEQDYPAAYLETIIQGFEMLCRQKHLIETVDPDTVLYMDALRKIYRTDTPLPKIAASLGYSNEYFIRLFRSRLGITPHQYIISLRMNDAIRLLAAGAALDEIAAAVGYTDGHSFANAFRRYYGISPAAYREHYAGYA